MKDYVGQVKGVTADVFVQARFYFRGDDWETRFDVPDEMQIDLGVGASRHRQSLWEEAR
jgi:hypothetical protein